MLSEKPAAPSLAQAQQLLAFHRSLPQVWAAAGCSTRCRLASSRLLLACPALPTACGLTHTHAQAPLWCVAENYRSTHAFLRLRDALRGGALGRLARLNMEVDLCEWEGKAGLRAATAKCRLGRWRRPDAGRGLPMASPPNAAPPSPCAAPACSPDAWQQILRQLLAPRFCHHARRAPCCGRDRGVCQAACGFLAIPAGTS